MTDTPITRRDLDEAMAGAHQQHDDRYASLQAAIDQRPTRDELSSAIANLATRDELSSAIANLATRDELSSAIANLATRDDLSAMEARLEASLARHANAIMDEMLRQFDAMLDLFRGLPQQQTALRTELDAHAANTRIHRPEPAPRRTRRSR